MQLALRREGQDAEGPRLCSMMCGADKSSGLASNHWVSSERSLKITWTSALEPQIKADSTLDHSVCSLHDILPGAEPQKTDQCRAVLAFMEVQRQRLAGEVPLPPHQPHYTCFCISMRVSVWEPVALGLCNAAHLPVSHCGSQHTTFTRQRIKRCLETSHLLDSIICSW